MAPAPTRTAWLVGALVVAAALLTSLAPSAAGAPADRLSSATLVANGNFAHGLSGWAGHASRLKLVHNRFVGRAVRVLPTTRGHRRGPHFIFRSPRPVRWAHAGRVYVAAASVRSLRPGHRVCLRVQEVAHGRLIHSTNKCLRAGRKWRLVAGVRYRAHRNGSQLGVSVRSRRKRAFEVDAVTLRALTASNAGGAVRPRTWLNPFPPNSLWNTPLQASPPLDPQNEAKMQYWLANEVRNPNMPLHAWNTAVAVAKPDTPRYTVGCTVYACPSLGQFGPIPIPSNTRPDPTPDGHLAVWDPATRREWDFWAGKCCWTVGSGGAFSTEITGPVSGGANAAGFPELAGIVRPEELKAGTIEHALVFAEPDVNSGGYVCPATHHDGASRHPLALPEGSLMQLDPALNVDALPIPGWQKTIARALQRYGMYLEDTGGSLSFGSENPLNRGYDAWAQVGLRGDSAGLSPAFPWSRMRVLEPPKPWC